MKSIEKLLFRCARFIFLGGVLFFFLIPQETMDLLFRAYSINHNYVVTMLFLGVILYLCVKRVRLSNILISIILYCGFVILDTALLKENVSYCFLMYGRFILTCMLIDNTLANRDYDTLRTLTFMLNTFVLINLISILNSQMNISNPMGKTYFLGFDNGNCIVIFPAILYNKLLCEIQGKEKMCLRMVYVWTISLVSVYLLNSATTTAGMILFIIMLVAGKFDIFHLLDKKTFIVLILVLFVAINLLRLQESFSFIIVNLLGRDLTFTGRVVLWDKAIAGIVKAPILGHGVNPESQRSYFLGVSSAHNQIFDVLYQTGIVGFVFFIAILALYIHKRSKYRKKIVADMDRYVNDMIFAFLLMMLLESYNSYLGFGLILSLFVLSDRLAELNDWRMNRKFVFNGKLTLRGGRSQ